MSLEPAGKGSNDTRTPDYKARRKGYDKINWSKRDEMRMVKPVIHIHTCNHQWMSDCLARYDQYGNMVTNLRKCIKCGKEA